MPHQKLLTDLQKRHINFYVLAFLSGSVNAGGLLACNRYVTHVTGFATSFGSELAQGNKLRALGLLTVPLFFLFGSFISGLLIEGELKSDRKPKYGWAMLLTTTCLLITSVFGYFDYFGQFGQTLTLKHTYILLALLCTAAGLQNAIITSISGAVIRTTHLTGITTDLGVGLSKIFVDLKYRKKDYQEYLSNYRRTGLIFSFIAGSAIGAIVCLRYGYLGFLLPTAIAALTTHRAFKYWYK